MVDFDKNIKAALEDILPCYYEHFTKDDISLPCITYIKNNDSSEAEGDTIRISKLDYTVKLWTDKKSDQEYLNDIDIVMKEMGFVRTSYLEIPNGRVIQYAMNYEATGIEVIT